MVTAKVEGNTLHISLPFDSLGAPSASGKTTVHASTHGNKVVRLADGKELTIGVNAYAKR